MVDAQKAAKLEALRSLIASVPADPQETLKPLNQTAAETNPPCHPVPKCHLERRDAKRPGVERSPASQTGEILRLRATRSAQDDKGVDTSSERYDKGVATRFTQHDKEGCQGGEEERKDAWKRIVALCSHNEFCQLKMRARLKREEYEPEDIEEALAKAVRVGLIDDVRWGEMRISGLMHKGEGREGIERDLRENGIDAYDVPGWPEEYSERFGGELERARKVLAAKPIRSKNPRSSAYARLVRKGYSHSIASQASSELPWSRS